MLIFQCSLLIIVVCLIYSTTSSAEWLDCKNSTYSALSLYDDRRIFIYDAEIHVKYDRSDLAVYEYAESRTANVLINNTAVFFSGNIVKETGKSNPPALRLSRVLYTQIVGTAHLKTDSTTTNSLKDCDLYLTRSRDDKDSDFPGKIQIEILHQAASCVRQQVCKRLGALNAEDFNNAKAHPYEFGSISVPVRESKIHSNDVHQSNNIYELEQSVNVNNLTSMLTLEQLHHNNVELQSTINILVDLAVAEIVREFRKHSNGTIKIPDISKKFSEDSEWQPTGEFDAINGVFSDLTTLERTDNAHLSHNGWKFTLSCGFGLSKAIVNYEKYKLRYGLKVSGNLWASVKGAALDLTLNIDYNQKPCQTTLSNLQITKMGQVDVKVTGLSPLNSLLSKIISWIAEKWKTEVVVEVQDEIRTIVQEHISQFNCERFRP
ncbi:hypothetical protein QAD02_014736 [Eretmocerus hayati]|uniref:Uncharacterized protein n=1 Tax=Eretmocerus hayati TaxID=131215 RepID=A0ACC2P8L6_9HYME|nr:hypothetical protein QAD02_014736 [Eretmocerus hayati]